ncbi:MAG TPA: DUF4831 family protein [Bacteroidales bacterium]|nr:DUF4831 family protein [Bacteroidales bacterium]
MKTHFKIFTIFVLSLILASCYSGRKANDATVSPLSEKTSVKNGSVIYGLPRTVFNIVVETQRTIEIPGPYAKYSGVLLGLDNVIENQNEYWEITGVKVESIQEIDPSELYVIEASSIFETNVLDLRSEGLILDINPDHYNSMGNQEGIESSEGGRFISSDLGSDEYFVIQRDTAFRRVNVDSTFIRIPYIVEKRKQLPDEQLAERAAKRLMEMREGEHFILTGESNVFPQNESVINEMNRLEKEYTELFAGKTIREKRTFTFQVIPEVNSAGKPVKLFQFSELTGPVAENQTTGEPVMITLTPEKKTKELSIIRSAKTEDKEVNTADKLFYRVPDVANLKIILGDEVLFNSRRLVYQYGEIIQLPSNFVIGK